MCKRSSEQFLVAVLLIMSISGCWTGNNTKVTLTDDFEGGQLADFWVSGDAGSGRYVPEAVSFTDQYHRSGAHCVRLSLEEGFIRQDGGDGHFTERTELDSRKHPFLNQEVWYRFSLLLPAQFPIIDNRLVISQMKQNGLEEGPLIAQRLRNGQHYLTIRDLTHEITEQHRFNLPELTKESWHDFIFQIRYSDQQDGYVNVWMDGTQVISFTGKTAYEKADNRFYHKIGLYRDQCPDPMTIYFDDYLLTSDTAMIHRNALLQNNE